jgi:hypothetical protein
MVENNNKKIQALIDSGEMDAILVHFAEADLSVRDTEELLAKGAVEAAKRKEKQSEEVSASVVGVEHLAPNAGRVESEQAGILRKFAQKLKATRSTR